MKKSYLLLFTLLVPTMISCGGDVNSSQDEIEEFDPNKSYQIDFLGWGGVAEQKNFQTLINKFMDEYPNVKVFYDAISDTTSYSTNLVNRANNLPDVFYVPDWDYIKWADSGKLLDYSEYLSEEEISKLWPASIDIFRFDEKTKTVGTGDKIYGLPKDLGPSAIVYNKTLMQQLIEEYHLDASLPSTTEPMTFSEFKEYLKKFKGLKVPDTFRCFGTNSSAKDEIAKLFGNRTYFQTPKPLKLMKELVRATTNKDSIVLDFFAGSGTVGHAVVDLNNEDNGNRKYILISNSESNICRNVTLKRMQIVDNNVNFLD